MDYNIWQWTTVAINIAGAGAYYYIVRKNFQLRKLWLQEIQETQRERELFDLFIRTFLHYKGKEIPHDR